MNKERRKALSAIIAKLEKIKVQSDNNVSDIQDQINSAKDDLEYVLSEEQYSLDSIPENLQSSYRYTVSEEACDKMENAIESLSDALDDDMIQNIDDAISSIYDAMM